MNSQRARLLLQMTMAFLLAVLVPLSIFGTFAYLKTQNDYLERAEKQYQQQLDIICHRLNSDLEQVQMCIRDSSCSGESPYQCQEKKSRGALVRATSDKKPLINVRFLSLIHI